MALSFKKAVREQLWIKVLLTGPSGAGKTTVLNILGGMDTATSGKLMVDGQDITSYDSKKLTGYRRDDIGFVFQFYNLVPNLTAVENVELALQICKDPLDAETVLKEVGLGKRLKNKLNALNLSVFAVVMFLHAVQKLEQFCENRLCSTISCQCLSPSSFCL